MEFKLTIDITDKLADVINALSASIAEATHKKSPQCAQEAPEYTKAPEPVITHAEPENAKIAPPESQESAPVSDTESGVRDMDSKPSFREIADSTRDKLAADIRAIHDESAGCDAEPAHVEPELPAVEAPEKPEPEKPKKKKSAKKAAEAPAPAEAPQPEPKPQPEPPAVEAPEKSEPAKVESAKEDEPKAADGDPMGGMTVMEAVQALFDAIQQKGLDMADVNARVRTKANELGLSYSSIACLIKAVGYVEARRIALGE